ncbi:MAG: phosphotransferase family protein, partial [Ktedonobacteraceae bacterium]
RDALEAVWPLPQQNASVLLHGDFWPGNIVWNDGQLVAVIDWEDAASGDPLADVANGRLEILWAFGIDAMQSFTQQYQSMTTLDFTDLPYWDLCAALRPASKISEWGVDDTTEKTMRERHKWFVARAFEKLSV